MLEKIQTLCKQKGISVSHLERELGFGRGSIYKWDKNSPSVDKLKKVADYLDVTVDNLLGRSNNTPAGIYLRLAKEAEEMGLNERDVQLISATLTRFAVDASSLDGSIMAIITTIAINA